MVRMKICLLVGSCSGKNWQTKYFGNRENISMSSVQNSLIVGPIRDPVGKVTSVGFLNSFFVVYNVLGNGFCGIFEVSLRGWEMGWEYD